MKTIKEAPTVDVAKTLEEKCSIVRVLIDGLDYIMKYKNLNENTRKSVKYIKQRYYDLMFIPFSEEVYLNKNLSSSVNEKDLTYPKRVATIYDLRELTDVMKTVKEIMIKSNFSGRKLGLSRLIIRNTIRQLLNLNYLKNYNSEFNLEYKKVVDETVNFTEKFYDVDMTRDDEAEFQNIMKNIIELLFKIGKI